MISAFSLWHLTSLDLNASFGAWAWARVFQASASRSYLFQSTPRRMPLSAGQEQQRLGDPEPLPQPRRKLRHLAGDDNARARCAVSPDRAGKPLQPLQPPVSRGDRAHLTSLLTTHGSLKGVAAGQAQGTLIQALYAQTNMLAYIDNFWILSIAAACMVPVILLMRGNRPGKGAGPAH